MKVEVRVYNMCKYNSNSEKIAEVEYNPIKIEVVKIPDEQIYAMGFDEIDEYGEYLIMTHGDGETSTFRNSHVDVFFQDRTNLIIKSRHGGYDGRKVYYHDNDSIYINRRPRAAYDVRNKRGN